MVLCHFPLNYSGLQFYILFQKHIVCNLLTFYSLLHRKHIVSLESRLPSLTKDSFVITDNSISYLNRYGGLALFVFYYCILAVCFLTKSIADSSCYLDVNGLVGAVIEDDA